MHYIMITFKKCFDVGCLMAIITHDRKYKSHWSICGKTIEEKHICVYSLYKEKTILILVYGDFW